FSHVSFIIRFRRAGDVRIDRGSLRSRQHGPESRATRLVAKNSCEDAPPEQERAGTRSLHGNRGLSSAPLEKVSGGRRCGFLLSHASGRREKTAAALKCLAPSGRRSPASLSGLVIRWGDGGVRGEEF